MSVAVNHQSTNARDPERDAYAVSLREAGYTLQEIGDILGVSRERVRQLVKRNGIEPGARERVNNSRRLDPLDVARFARSPKATSLSEVAHEFGTTITKVSELLHALGMYDAVRRLYRLRAREATRQRIVRDLQAFAKRHGRLPSSRELTNDLTPDLPAFQTITRAYGSLRNAFAVAGLLHLYHPRLGRPPRRTP